MATVEYLLKGNPTVNPLFIRNERPDVLTLSVRRVTFNACDNFLRSAKQVWRYPPPNLKQGWLLKDGRWSAFFLTLIETCFGRGTKIEIELMIVGRHDRLSSCWCLFKYSLLEITAKSSRKRKKKRQETIVKTNPCVLEVLEHINSRPNSKESSSFIWLFVHSF